VQLEDISHAAKARKLVDRFHDATRKDKHFKLLMTALFKLLGVGLLDVGQFDSAVRIDSDRWSQDPGSIATLAGSRSSSMSDVRLIRHRQIAVLEQLRDLLFDLEQEKSLSAALYERVREARLRTDREIEVLRT
jgi:hypothetical protein